MTAVLTDPRLSILRAIADLLEKNGWPPSIREIMDATGLRSTAHVQYHLKILAEDGYIVRGEFAARQLALTDAGRALLRGEV